MKKPTLPVIGGIAAGLVVLCAICLILVAILPSSDRAIPEATTPEIETIVLPTATLLSTNTLMPTDTPTLLPTPLPEPSFTLAIPEIPVPSPTLSPTMEPTIPSVPAGAQIIILNVDKGAEFVDLQNVGDQVQDLAGWHLLSEKGSQDCLLGGVMQPGEILRIWAMASDAGQGGFNCGFGSNIWNNSEPDPAVLYDATGREVDRK